MGDNRIERLQTGDLELGATEAVQRHVTRTVVQPAPVTQRKLDFEHSRPRWLRECMAEATGVFFYAITICFWLWQGFPAKKVPYYIFSQIFGAFVAGLILMGQYHQQISEFKAATEAAGLPVVSPSGPAGILCAFPLPTQTNQGYLFMIEFFVDSFIGIVIWSCLDPANPFVSPQSAPFTIGLAYGVMVWGFADVTISTNLARDLGTRIVAAIFFGGEAFSYDNGYAWISILVNVPATIFATGYYEFLMRDSLKKIGAGHAVHEHGEEGLSRHLSRRGILEDGPSVVKTKSQGDY
ncbi:MAG: hypothetical protein Q9165_004854 [Trypethelium subeluteriae]